MEVAVLEEPQKKIFRARKTMKMSDRQQLEVLHNTLVTTHPNSSSRPQTPLVNGTHGEDGQKGKDKDKETGTKSPTSPSSNSSPVPSRSLSLSRSPSPAENRNPSPSLKKCSEKAKGEEKKGEKDKKDEKKAEEVKADKTETTKSARTASPSVSDKKTEPKKTSSDQVLNGELPMDADSTSLDNGSAEEKSSKSISSSSPSGSPAASLECDPEVKEGFLCLSEEDEGQGEQDEAKDRNEEKMDVDPVKEEKKEGEKGCNVADGTGTSTTGKKRSLSPAEGKEGWKDGEIKEDRDGKRARVEGVQLEAQLELKITANAGSRLKLEKVVQQLVEERLRVLQLTVFDHSLQELKDRMEKIDAATKQQKTVQHTLQAALNKNQCPTVVKVSKHELMEFKRKLLNLEARIGWLEEHLKEKAPPSRPATADQSTSTDDQVAAVDGPETQSIQNSENGLFLHSAYKEKPTLASGRLDDRDVGLRFPSVASTPVIDCTVTQQTTSEHESSLDSPSKTKHSNHPPTTMSVVSCTPDQVNVGFSSVSNAKSKTVKKASLHHGRRSLVQGVVQPDVALNHVPLSVKKQMYLDSAGPDGKPRADRYATSLFKRLIPLHVYQDWVGVVNFNGSRGKNALPHNVRQAIADGVAKKFRVTAHEHKQIKDRINELLRKKRLRFPLF